MKMKRDRPVSLCRKKFLRQVERGQTAEKQE